MVILAKTLSTIGPKMLALQELSKWLIPVYSIMNIF